jgi:hypothetical protein
MYGTVRAVPVAEKSKYQDDTNTAHWTLKWDTVFPMGSRRHHHKTAMATPH